MTIEGYITRIRYQKEDTWYTVCDIEGPNGEETVRGTMPGADEGMYIRADGEYEHHPVYDLQFVAREVEVSMPDDEEGIIAFLGSGRIKGVGKTLAKRIVNRFGSETLSIIEKEPERLAEIKGISENMARNIAIGYRENSAYRGAIVYLTKYGLTTNAAVSIYNELGDDIYQIMKTNPYKIADEVKGIGFKTIDRIAVSAGIAPDSVFRLQSVLIYALTQCEQAGNMYMPEDELIDVAYSYVNSDYPIDGFSEKISDLLVEMSMDNKVTLKKDSDGRSIVYTRKNYRIELTSARMLTDLMSVSDEDDKEVSETIEAVEQELGIKLEEQQALAVRSAVSNGVAVITGGPGTGKTTIINAVIRYFEDKGSMVLLAAPTGRAAKRMTESTGHKAQTIHRLLEFSGDEDGRMRFMKNSDNPLECDAVIIDEASMVDAFIFYSLLSAITVGTRLILVGDVDQLPPVGAGNVLKDIIESSCIPVSTLRHVFRQNEESTIVANAHHIRNGERIEISNRVNGKYTDFLFQHAGSGDELSRDVSKLVSRQLPEYLGVSPFDIQVLTPMRNGDFGIEKLNKMLQDVLNPEAPDKREVSLLGRTYREGDKVMQTKNNYRMEWKIYGAADDGYLLESGVGVFNGDMGIITEINDFDDVITVRFDDSRVAEYSYANVSELEHAFAITVHKSQGSEYEAVVLPLWSVPQPLKNRKLLYTAVTRAKRHVMVVGDMNIFNQMIDNFVEHRRYTGFAERLREIRAADEM